MGLRQSDTLDEQIARAVEVLKQGGVVAFPTDTVYGLGSSSTLESALRRVFQIKQRPLDLALPLLLADPSDIEKAAASVSKFALKLAECFWPGGLTLVVHKANWISPLITAGGDTVAVRVPDHPVPRALSRDLGVPIVGTSANLSGQPSPLTAQEVHRQLGHHVDIIIEGSCPGGVESTVVDVTSDPPVLLREGAISLSRIETECGVKIRRK